MDISNKKVYFIGDSITEGHGASSLKDTSYVALFQKAYPNAEIINYGVGGTRIAKKKTPSNIPIYDRDFNLRSLEMKDGADLVVVFGGVNDYLHGDAVLGVLGDTDEYTFYGATRSLYEKLLNKYPTSRILIMTPLHCEFEEKPNAQGNVLKEFVTAIRETAELFSFPVLDLHAISGINPNFGRMKADFMPDGIHPNDAGYQRIFGLVDGFIKNL